MHIKRTYLLYIGSFYIILSLVIIIIYLVNPFYNECILGRCNNGYGQYFNDSGIKYDGEWENGKRHGKGTLTYPNGSKYEGEWRDNKFHGYGIKTYNDGKVLYYSGEWNNGKKHGKGIQYFSSKEWYEGEWENGQMHGRGTYVTALNQKYIGDWKNGQMNGSGTHYYPDGRIFKGKWKNHKRIDYGTLTYPDGSTITEQWDDGTLAGSPLFYMSDFDGDYKLIELYKAIQTDVDIRIKKQGINPIQWLNTLLKTPDLYELIHCRIDESTFSEEIKTLIESTKLYRNKHFSELTIKEKTDIKLLNRLLLEHCYPNKTPKVRR